MIDKKELNKIEYLDSKALGSRAIILFPFWNGSQWRQWIDVGNCTINELAVVDLIRGHYVAKAAASTEDLHIPFIDLIWQRMSWPEVYNLTTTLSADLQNLLTSAAKIKHFFKFREVIGNDVVPYFVITELEYILVVARSVFDLLQQIVAKIWNHKIKLHNPEAEALRRQNKLPEKRFAKMLETNKEQTMQKFAVPEGLAKEYLAQRDFFMYLRSARDRVVHGIGRDPIIFVTDKGFCVDPTVDPFCGLSWNKSHTYNENIVSLLPWIAYVIFQTIDACNRLVDGFAQHIDLPAEIAPGHRFFVRDQTSHILADLVRVQQGETVWWE